MRTFTGRGGAVHAVGEPFAFTRLPLADCGDGFSWRASDDRMRCWVAGAESKFEAYVAGQWEPVEALAVQHAAASVAFGRCLSGLAVHASGVALPTSLLATGERWTLEQLVLEGETLGSGPMVALGSATARLGEVQEHAWESLAAFGRVLAVLPSGSAGAFVGMGELAREGAGLRVTFDQTGVTYA